MLTSKSSFTDIKQRSFFPFYSKGWLTQPLIGDQTNGHNYQTDTDGPTY